MMTDTQFGLVQGKDMLYISQPSPLVFQSNLITFYRQFQNLTCKRNGATFPFIRKTPTLSSVTGWPMTQLTARTTLVNLCWICKRKKSSAFADIPVSDRCVKMHGILLNLLGVVGGCAVHNYLCIIKPIHSTVIVRAHYWFRGTVL